MMEQYRINKDRVVYSGDWKETHYIVYIKKFWYWKKLHTFCSKERLLRWIEDDLENPICEGFLSQIKPVIEDYNE